MSGPIKFMIIAAVALLLSGIVVFVVIPKIKRKKLSEGWADWITAHGHAISADQIRAGLDKLSNSEVDTVIDFSQRLQANDYAGMAANAAKTWPVLVKAGLDTIFT